MIRDFINRWRHSKGYGVHSPLGFRIVTECVRPPRGYAFYIDDVLDAKYSGMPDEKRFARISLRLENLIYPAPLTHVADKADLAQLVPAIRKEKEYTLIMPFPITESEIERLIPAATLIISGRKFTIIARRIGMDRVSYPVL